MDKYIIEEIRLLREGLQSFNEHHPQLGQQLNLTHLRDPYIERLLEGVAHITAQIKRRVDDDLPEISHCLLTHIAPELLAPQPAMSIAEFSFFNQCLEESYTVPAGFHLQTAIYQQQQLMAHSYFQTMQTLTLHPVAVGHCQLIDNDDGHNHLSISLDSVSQKSCQWSELSFYLHHDVVSALQLYHYLTYHVDYISLDFVDKTTKTVLLGKQHCITTDESWLSSSTIDSPQCFELLQHYFTFIEKYLFITMNGFDKIAWPKQWQRLEINIHFKQRLNLKSISQKNVRLHCTPIINLYEAQCSSICHEQLQSSYPLQVPANDLFTPTIYSIKRVTGRYVDESQSYEYKPLSSFNSQHRTNHYYQLGSGTNAEARVLQLPLLAEGIARQQLIDCEVRVCDGDIPHHFIKEGMLSPMNNDLPFGVSVTNILPPTKMYYSDSQENYHWHLLGSLSLHYQSLVDLTSLQSLLRLYNRSDDALNEQRIMAINHIEHETVKHSHHGLLVRGLRVCYTVDEHGFLSIADIYLFFTILHRFFSAYASINSLIITRVICQPSGEELIWQPIIGNNLPI